MKAIHITLLLLSPLASGIDVNINPEGITANTIGEYSGGTRKPVDAKFTLGENSQLIVSGDSSIVELGTGTHNDELILENGSSMSFEEGGQVYINSYGFKSGSVSAKDGGSTLVGHEINNVTLDNVSGQFHNLHIPDSYALNNVTIIGSLSSESGSWYGSNVDIAAKDFTLNLGEYSGAVNHAVLQGNFNAMTLSGSFTLDVDFSGQDTSDISITLTGVDSSNLSATDVFISGYEFSDSGVFTFGSNGFSYKGAIKAIPEPSTATLSLLALAGLMTRRRRKA